MTAPDSSNCPRCGIGMRCGMVTGDSHCWCFDMPRVIPVPTAERVTGTSCLCPACLQDLIDSNDLPPPRD